MTEEDDYLWDAYAMRAAHVFRPEVPQPYERKEETPPVIAPRWASFTAGVVAGFWLRSLLGGHHDRGNTRSHHPFVDEEGPL
jgi:hypothetical protein